jgi:hypothetical protein
VPFATYIVVFKKCSRNASGKYTPELSLVIQVIKHSEKKRET